jgi:DNA ligase 1
MPTPRLRCLVLLFLVLFASCAVTAGEAPRLMLASVWDEAADPTGWWMSEKYDGVRGYWDGERMVTRGGEAVHMPAELRAALPPFPLDGELWAGRGRFEEALSVVRAREPGSGWASMRYMVFDAPAHNGTFEERMAAFEAWSSRQPPSWVLPVAQIRCEGPEHLQTFLMQIERGGGEGAMLRAPGSPYERARSSHLRKLKSFDDREATVVGYRPGRGKYEGHIGSLLVELADGTRFFLGSGLTDAQRREPPAIGTVVTFKHWGWTTHGKPRFPVLWRQYEQP